MGNDGSDEATRLRRSTAVATADQTSLSPSEPPTNVDLKTVAQLS